MTIKVYRFPDPAPRAWMWFPDYPVQESASTLRGDRFRSAGGPMRRNAMLEIHGRRDGFAAGYMDVMADLLEGGTNAVRLYSRPNNWHLDAARDAEWRQSVPLLWASDGADLEWTSSGVELGWFDGALLTGTTGTDAGGFPNIIVSGLPPSRLVARPGEFLTVFDSLDASAGQTVKVMRPAYSDASGVANIRLVKALPALADVRVNLGASETGVFLPDSIPSAPQNTAGDWVFRWTFTEIFADPYGGFEEIDTFS